VKLLAAGGPDGCLALSVKTPPVALNTPPPEPVPPSPPPPPVQTLNSPAKPPSPLCPRAVSPFLQALLEAQGLARGQDKVPGGSELDCRDLAVELLAHDDASAFALALLGEMEASKSSSHRNLIEAIARESSGNPFFVTELVRHVQADARENLESASGRSANLTGRRNRASWCWMRCSGRGFSGYLTMRCESSSSLRSRDDPCGLSS
jgi:hypothetical protein